MKLTPYLSVILIGRNDNYGGDFRSRLQRSVKTTVELLEMYSIRSELIFVNYNPLPDEVPIDQFIDWPHQTECVTIRIISVPKEVHRQICAKGIVRPVPVLEYYAKNVGIRRAKGEFILSMNPDIILPLELVAKLKALDASCYYRADRVDFSVSENSTKQYSKVFLKGHAYRLTSLKDLSQLRRNNALLNVWKRFTPKISWLLNLLSVPVFYNNVENRFHCNVSGDFMLMHCENWNLLKGHYEARPIALHVDALMVVQAACSGLREIVFEHPILHQEHERRYDANDENQEYLEAFQFFANKAKEMVESKKAGIYNSEEWGLSNFDLPETII
jgi:hypothetical protein